MTYAKKGVKWNAKSDIYRVPSLFITNLAVLHGVIKETPTIKSLYLWESVHISPIKRTGNKSGFTTGSKS
jgi:hypothetical protein